MKKERPQPFVLVADNISHDTVQCLTDLLKAAKAGDVVGLAFTAMLKRRGFVVNTAGEAHRNPTFTRGMLAALDDRLGQRIRGED